MERITSKDNQYLKTARAVQQKKGRKQQGCFLVEGVRLAEEAVSSGSSVRYALFAESALDDVRTEALALRMQELGIPMSMVSDELLRSAAATENPQGVLLLVDLPAEQAVPAVAGGCYAYADGVRDPGNLGTIIRSAYAAGVSGLILSPDSADVYNPKVVRSSMGAVFRLPMQVMAGKEAALELMRGMDARIIVAAMDGRDVRKAADVLRDTHVWILGSEAEGAADFWREQADLSVSLPMREDAESLNVASAAVVLFYQSLFARE